MKQFFDQIPFFAISKMAQNQFLNWEKVYKTAKNGISWKIFLIYLISRVFSPELFLIFWPAVYWSIFFSWTYFEIWVSQVNGTESLILFPAFCSSNSPGNLELKKSSWLSGYLKMEKIHFCRRKYNQHSKGDKKEKQAW